MKSKLWKRLITAALATGMIFSLTACGGKKVELNDGTFKAVDASELTFPQAEKVTRSEERRVRNPRIVRSSSAWKNRPTYISSGMRSRTASGATKSRHL